jgi:hypothetical protein
MPYFSDVAGNTSVCFLVICVDDKKPPPALAWSDYQIGNEKATPLKWCISNESVPA